jgi:hypothetical protein
MLKIQPCLIYLYCFVKKGRGNYIALPPSSGSYATVYGWFFSTGCDERSVAWKQNNVVQLIKGYALLLSVRFVPNFSVIFSLVFKIHSFLFPIKRHVLKGGVESWSGVSTPSWSGAELIFSFKC